ncbi:GGDEF domain-containing protein [Bordetella sp. 2513F-2]
MQDSLPNVSPRRDQPPAGRILAAISRLLQAPAHPAFFQDLVECAVLDIGADCAWVALKAPDGTMAVSALRACEAIPPEQVAQAAAALQAGLAAGLDVLCPEGAAQRWAEIPWFDAFGAVACASTALRGTAGVVGQVTFVFRHGVGTGEVHADALRILGAHASHALIRTEELERRLAQAQAAVAQYEFLFHKAPVLINAYGADGKLLLWNEECERTFGWTLPELNRHDDPLALFYPDPAARQAARDNVRASPVPAFHERSLVARDGTALSIMWANVLLPDGMAVNIGFDVTARRQAEAALQRLARVDSLTGCWNRGEVLNRLDDMVRRVREGSLGRLAAMMIDLDLFKQINDNYGHHVGDAALRHFCECVRRCVRDTDVVGRLGGEEFVVLLPEADEAGARVLWDRLRTTLRDTPLPVGEATLVLSASAGVARLADDDEDASDLLRRADGALYDAKRAGRDRMAQG